MIAGSLFIVLQKGDWFSIKDKKDDKKIEQKDEPKTEEKFTYTPVMYKICDDDNCNYLVGAMHMGDSRINSFSDKVMNAYKEMDSVAVELDNVYDISINDYVLPDDKKIDDLISSELNQKLIEFASKHPFFMYDQFKKYIPGFFYDIIESVMYLELGYEIEGVDTYFANLAKKDNKEVISIEKTEDQTAFFTNYSNELFIYLIEKSIDNYDAGKELSKNLYDAYLAGDANKIASLIASEYNYDIIQDEKIKNEFKKYNEDLLDNRNIVMANAIVDFLEKDKNVFVTVGAAHVVSDNGIITLLSNKGYTITSMN